MTNIEKLLDALLHRKGERMILDLVDPPRVIQKDQQFPLLKNPLTGDALEILDREWRQVFAGQEHFAFKGNSVQLIRRDGYREFILAPSSPSGKPESETDAATSQVPDDSPTSSDPTPWETPPKSSTGVPPEITVEAKSDTIQHLLRWMVQHKASDLHLSAQCRPMVRIDGDMITLEEFEPITDSRLWSELQEFMPQANIQEFNDTHDTDFAYEIADLARFRGNIYWDHRGLGAVFRRIPSQIIPASDLDVPSAVIELCSAPKGLILVTGPTGSGKSTTLAALIDHINRTQPKHIITIEDPVEFVHRNQKSLINQREIKTHTQSFKRALRAALREDPDVILVGEMRDLETIAIAIEMAATGHLVFGTLHTSTATGTVDRIIDQFPPDQQEQIRTMLADALLAVLAQMLCKRKQGGRVAAYEVLIINVAISNMIREGKTFQIPTIMQTGKALGNRLLNDSLTELVEKGIVDAQEALSKSIDKDPLKNRLKSKGLLSS